MRFFIILTVLAPLLAACPFLDKLLPGTHNHGAVNHTRKFLQPKRQKTDRSNLPRLVTAEPSLVSEIKTELKRWFHGATLPTVARLGFHSCVEGCNGCLNIQDPDNKGLNEIIQHLELIYRTLKGKISRADFWATASMFAIEETVNLNNDDCLEQGGKDCHVPFPSFEYFTGRKDCATSPHTDDFGGLPDANLEYDEVMEYFKHHFDMNPKEVTALLGVHTLGRATLENTGFNGEWVEAGDANVHFNNEFYKQMVNPSVNWRQKRETENHPWWWKAVGANGNGDGFRITSDVSLYKNLKVDSDGFSTCSTTGLLNGDFQDCPNSPTAGYVTSFASSNSAWMKEFRVVYTKMLANGYSYTPSSGCSYPSSPPRGHFYCAPSPVGSFLPEGATCYLVCDNGLYNGHMICQEDGTFDDSSLESC